MAIAITAGALSGPRHADGRSRGLLDPDHPAAGELRATEPQSDGGRRVIGPRQPAADAPRAVRDGVAAASPPQVAGPPPRPRSSRARTATTASSRNGGRP